jgi:hypothetical protein
MSLDISIIPAGTSKLTAGRLANTMAGYCSTSDEPIFRFKILGNEYAMSDDDVLRVGEHYQLIGAGELTLTIAFEETDLDDKDYEIDILEDYGKNLSSDDIDPIVKNWKSNAYTVKLSSYVGRTNHELNIMKCLAVSLAEALDGLIVINNNDFLNIPIGIYFPDKVNESDLV